MKITNQHPMTLLFSAQEIAHNLYITYGIGRNQRHLQGENFVDKGAVLTKFITHNSQLGLTALGGGARQQEHKHDADKNK